MYHLLLLDIILTYSEPTINYNIILVIDHLVINIRTFNFYGCKYTNDKTQII